MDIDFGPILNTILGSLATAFATVIVAWGVQQARKVGMEISAERQAQVEKFVADKILEVAERAAADQKLEGLVRNGAAKMNDVVTATMAKFPRVDALEAEKIATAMLPKLGQGALAGVTELGKALGTPRPAAVVVVPAGPGQ